MTLKELIPSFPRKIGFPEKIVAKTEEEFYRLINKYNGISRKIYFALYNLQRDIHLISFDLDSDSCLYIVKKILVYLDKRNLRYCVIFSTGGFWIHIRTKPSENINHKKSALRNAQMKIVNDLGLTVGNNPKEDDVDFHILGDIERISRMPGTLDLDRGLYCISVSKEDIEKGFDFIKEKAKKQDTTIHWYNEGLLDLTKFDYPTEHDLIDFREFDYNFDIKGNKILEKCLPCVVNCLLTVPLKGHNRFWVITTIYLKERWGMNEEQIKKFIRPYLEKRKRNDGLGKNDFQHYVIFDDLPRSVFRSNYFFPTCDKLFELGFCKGKCKFYNNRGVYI